MFAWVAGENYVAVTAVTSLIAMKVNQSINIELYSVTDSQPA